MSGHCALSVQLAVHRLPVPPTRVKLDVVHRVLPAQACPSLQPSYVPLMEAPPSLGLGGTSPVGSGLPSGVALPHPTTTRRDAASDRIEDVPMA